MHEPQSLCVECHPPDGERIAGRLAVHRIPQHRMTEEGEVDADLVGPPGAEFGLDQCHRSQSLERAECRDGRTPASSWREGSPPCSRPGPADGTVHSPLAGQLPPHEGDIPSLDGVSAELPLQVLGGGVGKCEYEHARGLPVETVHNMNASVAPRSALDLGSRAADDGVLVGIGRGMDEQPCGLVDHEDVRVDVEDLNRRQPGHDCAPRQTRSVRDDVSRCDERAGVGDDHAVDEDMSDRHLLLGTRVGGSQQALGGPGETLDRGVHDRSVALLLAMVDSAAPSGLG